MTYVEQAYILLTSNVHMLIMFCEEESTMKTKNFKSRLIYSIEYIFSEKLLVVELNKGGIYKYFGVPFSEYLKLRFSKSPGHYYTNLIKNNGKYRFEKHDIIPLKIR